jgi:uncharacterized protein (TIGR02646 family)
MRQVFKLAEPKSFADWKSKASENWLPRYANLQNPEKRALHQALIDEQFGTCCYCGRSISTQSSHVEHFRPQDSWPELDTDYANLHASCLRREEPGVPLHCGHAKRNFFNEALVISPLAAGCDTRFLYMANTGEIGPADLGDRSASYMIDLLKLDIPFLRTRRRLALLKVFDEVFLENATEEELSKLATLFAQPDEHGLIDDFSHVVARYARQLLRSSP